MGSLVGQHRGQHPPGPEDRRRHGALRGHGRRGREGAGRRGQFRARPIPASRPGCSARSSPGSTTARATATWSAPATTSRKLPPEFSRGERFDGIFFLDLPGRQQKDAIWDIYLEMFELDADQARPKDDQWTGAEIRACCRLAALLDVPLTAAAQNVVPVAVTAAESVERLRQWAAGGASMPRRAGSTGPTARARWRSPAARSGAIRRTTDWRPMFAGVAGAARLPLLPSGFLGQKYRSNPAVSQGTLQSPPRLRPKRGPPPS